MLRRGIQEQVVFNAHEKTMRAASAASDRAADEFCRMGEEIGECRASQRKFFNARRQIKQAAQKIAGEHNIDLQDIDPDSEEERHDFYRTCVSGISTMDSTMVGASYESSHGGSPSRPVQKRFSNLARNRHSSNYDTTRPFCSTVNRNF